jgi:hypothetical protein
LFEEFWVLGKRAVDNVSKERLIADVDVSNKGESSIPPVIAVIDKEKLKSLEKLHQKEPKYTNGKSGVICSGVNIIGQK